MARRIRKPTDPERPEQLPEQPQPAPDTRADDRPNRRYNDLPETDPPAHLDQPAGPAPPTPWIRSPRRPDDIVANDPTTGTEAESSPPGEDQLSQGHVDRDDTATPIEDHSREAQGPDADPPWNPDPEKPADIE